MKIIKQEEYNLLNRNQFEFELDHAGSKTPSKQEVLNKAAEVLKVNPELIKIKTIHTKYGGSSSRIIANVYKNIESLKIIEEFRKKPKKKKEKKAAPAK